MDDHLAAALRKFAHNEIAAFRRPSGSPVEKFDPEDPVTFSRLCTYLAVLRMDIPVLSYEDAITEGRDDCGLDGLAVAIGDQPLSDPDEAAALAEATLILAEQGSEPARPRVLFVQAKRSPVCSNNEVKLFGVNALDFLTMPRQQWLRQKPNPAVLNWWHIYDRIRQVYETHGRPFIVETDLVFAYSGLWSEEKTRPESSRVTAEDRLREQIGHSHARFAMWGAEEIAEALSHTTTRVTHVLEKASLVEFPQAPARGFLGHAPATSILALLPETAGSLDESVFAENVRSFLGLEPKQNPGAAGLSQTLASGCGDEVILRHNGITIVARDAALKEEDLHLVDYQIVNGAQTAHVLHEKRDQLEGVHLAVKVVITEDDDIKNEVIRGANTQSPVDDYDMLSRIPFLRRLEEEFLAMEPNHPEKLWLQRRRGERLFARNYDPHRVVTPRQLLEAFAATLLASPHAVHATPGRFLDHARREKIFSPDHSPTLYRALGWLLVAARQWADRKSPTLWLDQYDLPNHSSAYPARHQFLYALWLLTDPAPGKSDFRRGSPEAEHRFETVCQLLSDPAKAKSLTDRAGNLVKGLFRKGTKSTQVSRLAFTEKLQEAVAGKPGKPPSPPKAKPKKRRPRSSRRPGS